MTLSASEVTGMSLSRISAGEEEGDKVMNDIVLVLPALLTYHMTSAMSFYSIYGAGQPTSTSK